MKNLTKQDFENFISALTVLHAGFDVKTLPQRTIQTVGQVILADIISFDAFNAGDKYEFTAWTTDEDLYKPELMVRFQEYVHQHPLIPVVVGGKIQTAIKMTDYVTQNEFENLELYYEYFRLIRVRQQMGLALPVAPDYTVACSVNRWENDFSERERHLLTLIAPHLINAVRNAYAYERLNFALESNASGVIVIRGEKIQFVSEFAAHLLETYFAGEKYESNLPETLRIWLKQNTVSGRDFNAPLPPLVINRAESNLRVRLLVNSVTHERTILLEEKRTLLPKMLEQLGLTKREAEILFWITKGKTNDEIGILCNISSLTVKKHIEHIYQKLGIETRTAAMQRALEIL